MSECHGLRFTHIQTDEHFQRSERFDHFRLVWQGHHGIPAGHDQRPDLPFPGSQYLGRHCRRGHLIIDGSQASDSRLWTFAPDLTRPAHSGLRCAAIRESSRVRDTFAAPPIPATDSVQAEQQIFRQYRRGSHVDARAAHRTSAWTRTEKTRRGDDLLSVDS